MPETCASRGPRCTHCGQTLVPINGDTCLGCLLTVAYGKAPLLPLALRWRETFQFKPRLLLAAASEAGLIVESLWKKDTITIKACEQVEFERQTSDLKDVRPKRQQRKTREQPTGKPPHAYHNEDRKALIAGYTQLTHGLCTYCGEPLGDRAELDVMLPVGFGHSGAAGATSRLHFAEAISRTALPTPACQRCNWLKGRAENRGGAFLRLLRDGFISPAGRAPQNYPTAKPDPDSAAGIGRFLTLMETLRMPATNTPVTPEEYDTCGRILAACALRTRHLCRCPVEPQWLHYEPDAGTLTIACQDHESWLGLPRLGFYRPLSRRATTRKNKLRKSIDSGTRPGRIPEAVKTARTTKQKPGTQETPCPSPRFIAEQLQLTLGAGGGPPPGPAALNPDPACANAPATTTAPHRSEPSRKSNPPTGS